MARTAWKRSDAVRWVRHRLARRGWLLARVTPSRLMPGPPPDDPDPPRGDHPHLEDLRRRYEALRSPQAATSHWEPRRVARNVDLSSFRADNLYVWQDRAVRITPGPRQYLYAVDVTSRCGRSWLTLMEEDGAYGCSIEHFASFGVVSRDLLDSIVELDFLERHVPRLGQPGAVVVDVGAGYGRLAHRAATVFPELDRWYCVDAVPESTYLSAHYLAYRGVIAPDGPAEVVALDQLDARLGQVAIDLAVNVHSFSEMSLAAVAGWLQWLVDRGVDRLFLVPNEPDEPTALELDGRRPPLLPALRAAGFEPDVVEPVVADPDIRRLIGIHDRMWLFQRATR